MKIKHFVITRFLSWGPGAGFGDKMFSKETIDFAFSMIEKYFLLSLNNQSNKNFSLIFLVHNDFDIKEIFDERFNSLDIKMPYFVLHSSDLDEFLLNNLDNSDFLITTRMDYDDLVKSTAIDEVQNACLKHINDPLFTYGYAKGYFMTTDTNDLIYTHETPYFNERHGYFSIFMSLCINLNKIKELKIDLINVYSLGYHHDIRKGIENFINYYKIKINNYLYTSNDEDNYVWVRHKNSGSEFLNMNPPIKRKQIKIDNNTFKERFGYELK